MNARYLVGAGIVTAMLCSTAGARGIAYDSGQWDQNITTFPGSISNGLATLNIDGITLDLSPGDTTGLLFVAGVNDQPPGTSIDAYDSSIYGATTAAYQFIWGSNPLDTNSANQPIQDQIGVYQWSSHPNLLEIDWNYLSSSCASQVASFSIAGDPSASASATNPCANNNLTTGNVLLLTLSSTGGVVSEQFLGSGWTSGGSTPPPVSAPEPSTSGLTLLAAGSLLLIARRRWRVSASAR